MPHFSALMMMIVIIIIIIVVVMIIIILGLGQLGDSARSVVFQGNFYSPGVVDITYTFVVVREYHEHRPAQDEGRKKGGKEGRLSSGSNKTKLPRFLKAAGRFGRPTQGRIPKSIEVLNPRRPDAPCRLPSAPAVALHSRFLGGLRGVDGEPSVPVLHPSPAYFGLTMVRFGES